MKRFKGFACGYNNYECEKPKFRTFERHFISDPINYNRYNALISERSNFQNFYNIPRSFEGVISHTPFIQFLNTQSQSSDSNSCISCIDVDSPFAQNAAFFYEKLVQKNKGYISTWYKSTEAIQYPYIDVYYGSTSDSASWNKQRPGILMPVPTMSPFNTVGALAIPTAALASPSKKYISENRSTKSGCPTGFDVRVAEDDSKDEISVTTGSVAVSLGENGTTVKTISDVKLQYVATNGSETTASTIQLNNMKNYYIKCAIYAVAYVEVSKPDTKTTTGGSLQWKAHLYADVVYSEKNEISDDQPTTVINHLNTLLLPKYKLVANVIWNKDTQTYDVTSACCSPVDLRDWVSEAQLPVGEDNTIFVFGMLPNSTIKKWFPVKDC